MYFLRRSLEFWFGRRAANAAHFLGIAALGWAIVGGLPSAEALSFSSRGNALEFLETGQALNQKRLALISEAERFIYIKTFILNDDASEFPVFEALCAKARAGVDVRVLVDDLGSRFGGNPTPRSGGRYSVAGLESCGIRFEFFSPLTWGLVDFALYRQHDKLLVTENGAILGGTNFSRDYSAHAQLSKQWYDLDIAVEGPAICDVHWKSLCFARTPL